MFGNKEGLLCLVNVSLRCFNEQRILLQMGADVDPVHQRHGCHISGEPNLVTSLYMIVQGDQSHVCTGDVHHA